MDQGSLYQVILQGSQKVLEDYVEIKIELCCQIGLYVCQVFLRSSLLIEAYLKHREKSTNIKDPVNSHSHMKTNIFSFVAAVITPLALTVIR